MTDNKLKIRIQLQQPSPQAIEEIYPDLAEPEVIYEESLDWKKISIAVLLLLIILILIGYFFWGGSKAQLPDSKPDINSIPSSPEDNQGLTKNPAESALRIEDNLSLSNKESFPHVIQASDAPELPKVIPVVARSKPVAELKPVLKANESAIMPRQKPVAAALSQSPFSLLPADFSSSSSDSPQVLRAQLSHEIKAREPIDIIDSVQLHPGESKSIYFYLHLKDLQGKKVSILWYRENKLDSQLFLQIHNNNWRTNASKQLDRQRLGAWRVEVADESGNRLATRDFTVTE